MKIDGKAIASTLFQNLEKRVALLKEKGIIPHIAIILIGDNPASISYVKRKQIKAEELGAKATIINYPLRRSLSEASELGITNEELLKKIEELNNDNSVHGIIIQRPLPEHIDTKAVNQSVRPEKDIDAFNEATLFEMPLAKAVILLLENVYKGDSENILDMTFIQWLQSKNIVVIGKGETGGGPIINLLKKNHVEPLVIDSKTPDPLIKTKQADIIISAVGKEKVLTGSMLKKGVILISVGQHKQKDEKFHGDYENKDIETIASYYSPTPGGVGPVNVICLLQNLIEATERQQAQR